MTKELEERLLRLKQSYEKLPIQSEPKNIMNQLPMQKFKTKNRRKRFILPMPAFVFVTFILLGTVSTVWVLNNPTSQSNLPITETNEREMDNEDYLDLIAWTNELEVRYENSIQRYAEELGLTIEQIESLSYIQNSYSLLKYTVDLVEEKEIRYDNTNIKEWEQRIMDSIRPPSEMLLLLEKGEKLSLEEEHSFLLDYGDKIKSLSSLYNELLKTNTLQADSELLKMQGFILATNNNGEFYQYIYDDFKPVVSEKLSASAFSYLEALSMQPYFYAGDFLFSVEEMTKSMLKLEVLLTNENYEQFQDYDLLKLYYQGGIFKLFTGTDSYHVKENNTYSTSLISVLNQLIEQDSAVSELAKTILMEIENSNHSETIENLTYDQIWMEVLKKKYGDIDLQIK
ncbi:hypothetical protein [Ureibacillus acetophenoni]|uniref:Uncharacterized protein n=1 Tax=Ureibacillus acetophenoni TaxID=614649 RepID=A0A285U3L0_9BACL|nr:hypothetical protein [Ureibacillus acetophenoni]SOC36534.1 hypothetical protein SAMN05877842_102456 [Ureibacillus acetophenoni]